MYRYIDIYIYIYVYVCPNSYINLYIYTTFLLKIDRYDKNPLPGLQCPDTLHGYSPNLFFPLYYSQV